MYVSLRQLIFYRPPGRTFCEKFAHLLPGEGLVFVLSGIAARHVHCIFPTDVSIFHSELIPLVSYGHSWQQHVQHVQTVYQVRAETSSHTTVVVISKLHSERSVHIMHTYYI